MASKQDTAFDDLEEIEIDEQGNDSDWIELEPGESVTGDLTDFSPLASYNGVVEIDGFPYRLNASLRRSIISALINDVVIGVRKSESVETFEDEDGEEVEYHPREVRVEVGIDGDS